MLIKTVKTREYAKRDVYNPSIPFNYGKHTYVLGRIESRNSEKDTVSAFFKETKSGVWKIVKTAPMFNLQDPFITKIKDYFILGGIEVIWDKNGLTNTYRTSLYYGTNPFELTHLCYGPDRMKGIRLFELEDKIGVFTRPQGKSYGLGKIGFTTIDNLESLSAEFFNSVPLIQDQFGENKWGGVNHALNLGKGKVGVIGHRAWFTDFGRRYEAISFEMDVKMLQCTEMKTIADRSNFPAFPSKRPDLADVIYPSGIYKKQESYVLLAGLSDAAVGKFEIQWPFSTM